MKKDKSPKSSQQSRESNYQKQLKNLYDHLDQIEPRRLKSPEEKIHFVRRMRGKLLRISRLRRERPIEDVLNLLNMTSSTLIIIENGWSDMAERDFFILLTYYGCVEEIAVFTKKLECALVPGLRESKIKVTTFIRSKTFSPEDPGIQ